VDRPRCGHHRTAGPPRDQRRPRPRRHSGPDDALGYTVTIEAGSTYDIDWGDGTTLTGVTSQGGPYPNGDLRHSYQVVQTDNTVSVTQRWTARWTATGNGQTVSGVIDADDTLYTSAALPLEIRQIQAVRND
jgi:hypothetical protein